MTARAALFRKLDQIDKSGLRHKIPVGLEHVEYNAYKFLADMTKCHAKVLVFLTFFEK
jgi:hypothetical protein